MESEKIGIDDLYRAEIETHRKQLYGYPKGEAEWDELGGWDCHIYTTMYGIDN